MSNSAFMEILHKESILKHHLSELKISMDKTTNQNWHLQFKNLEVLFLQVSFHVNENCSFNKNDFFFGNHSQA